MKKVIAVIGLIVVLVVGTYFVTSSTFDQRLEQIVNEQANDTEPANFGRTADTRTVINQEDAQIEAIEKVSDSVVGVLNLASEQVQGEGSGVIYKHESGNTFIVTNDHVVKGSDSLEVVFANGQRYPAQLVGTDPYTDLAVIKVMDEQVGTAATFGYTEDLKTGQTVIAIGNPLGLEFAGSATSGIVSGHDRTVGVQIGSGLQAENWEMTVLQTDVAINPGNSGGALINLDGEVVGINSMKIASSSIEGMSFSIPTYVVIPVIEELEATGSVSRLTLGVAITDLNAIPAYFRDALKITEDLTGGIFVNSVVENSVAQKMGIEAGDVIIAIGDEEITSATSFRKALFSYSNGDELHLTILRDGQTVNLSTKVEI